jgi:DHA2 family multidrug resistance protein
MTATAIGVPPAMIAAGPAALNDPAVQSLLGPIIEKAAFTETTNLAWMLIAILSLVSMAALPFILGGKAPEQQRAVQCTEEPGKVADGVE